MLQQHGQRRPWQHVGAYSGNQMSPPEKRVSPNTPPPPSPPPSLPPSPSPSSGNNNHHHHHNQHDRMLTGGSLPSSPRINMIPGAPHRQDQEMQMSPVVPLPLSQMAGQVDAREGRVRQPNRNYANDQTQQHNIRNKAQVRTAGRRIENATVTARARNLALQQARNNNINLTPPEHTGN